jgi:hypothetical protein
MGFWDKGHGTMASIIGNGHHVGNDWWIMGFWDKGHGTMASIIGNECDTM